MQLNNSPVSSEQQWIPVEHSALYCHSIGAGHPIAFVHGGGCGNMGHRYLIPELSELSDAYRCIFYDQRCAGQSTAPITTSALDPNTAVDDLERLRVHFDIKKFSIVGHSWGGFVSLLYAMSHPEHVESVKLPIR